MRVIGKTWFRKGFEMVKIDLEKVIVLKDDDDVNVYMVIVE